jgi:hypothetical protein
VSDDDDEVDVPELSGEDEPAPEDDDENRDGHDGLNEDGDATHADKVENNEPEPGSVENEGESANDEPRSDGRPRRSTQARQRRQYAPRFERKSYEAQFLSVTKRKQKQWFEECHRIAVNVMFTQMSAAKGIKLFGKRAVAAIFKEYNQLNDMTVFGKVNPDTLSPEQRKI